MRFLTVPLPSGLDRSEFHSGNSALDNYFHRQAGQDLKRKLATIYVRLNGHKVLGYYTLSSAAVPMVDVPEAIARRMPRTYVQLPATLLGRLAVDVRYHGQGHGRLLLLDSLHRSVEASEVGVGSFAVVVDPINDEATGFYRHFGFIQLESSGRMFLPMATVRTLF